MKNIRKTKVLLPVMLAAVALSACENTPDNIRSNKHSAEVDSGEAYVSPENIYDSFDAAFEKEYTKFKLPEKSAVSICKPDGVYDLELAYINAENDMDWLSSKVEELQSALDIKIDGKIETVEDQAQLQDEHNKLKITRFAQPYCCWETSENGVNSIDAGADNMELFYLDRPTAKNADSGLLSVRLRRGEVVDDHRLLRVADDRRVAVGLRGEIIELGHGSGLRRFDIVDQSLKGLLFGRSPRPCVDLAGVLLDGHDVPSVRCGDLLDRLVHQFGPSGGSRAALVTAVVVHGGESVVVLGDRAASVVHVRHLHLVETCGFQYAGQMLHGVFRETVADEEDAQFCIAARTASARAADLVDDVRERRFVRALLAQVVSLIGFGVGVEDGRAVVVGADFAACGAVGPLRHAVVVGPENAAAAVAEDRAVVGAVLEGRVACRRRDAAAAGTGRRGEIAVVRTSDHRRPCAHVAGDVTQTSRIVFRTSVQLLAVIYAVGQLGIAVGRCDDARGASCRGGDVAVVDAVGDDDFLLRSPVVGGESRNAGDVVARGASVRIVVSVFGRDRAVVVHVVDRDVGCFGKGRSYQGHRDADIARRTLEKHRSAARDVTHRSVVNQSGHYAVR